MRRGAATAASYVVFAVLLINASGLPLVAASLLQQVGLLDAKEGLLMVLFPLQWQSFTKHDGRFDLVNVNYLTLAVPWFLASIAWEVFVIMVVLPPDLRPTHQFRLNDSISSLSTGILFLLISQVVFVQWGRPLYEAIYTHLRLTSVFEDQHSVAGWWLCFLATDVLYYVYHRASHHISWFWASHVVHHSSEEYNLTTALRQPANDFLVPSVLISSTTMAFFFPPQIAQLHGQLSLLYQFWIHTQLVPPLPVVELIFNTPSLHRIHHARNPAVLGKNYGGIFSLWDRLGGTLEQEHSAEAEEDLFYGVIPPLNSWNPVWANICHLHHMFFTQRSWHGFKTPFVHWTPPGGQCPKLGSRLNPKAKFDAAPDGPLMQAFVLAEFLFVAVWASLLLFLGPPVEGLASAVGWSSWTAGGMSYSIAFGLTVWALVIISQLESAKTARVLRQALLSNITLCAAVLTVAEMLLALNYARGGNGLASPWQLPLASYLLFHVGFWVALWPSNTFGQAREPLSASTSSSCQ